MGFIPHMWHSESEPWETIPNETKASVEVGTALVLEDGTAEVAAGAVEPTFISMQDGTPDRIHVERVREETVYETELAEASAAIAVGEKYNIDTTGTMLTATAGGSAEVVSFDGTEAGDKVRVRFV